MADADSDVGPFRWPRRTPPHPSSAGASEAPYALASLRTRITVPIPQPSVEWLVSFASGRSERGCQQAGRVALTIFCRCNNSPGDDLARHLGLAGRFKLFEGGFESFAHRRYCLRFERSRLYK